MKHIIIKTLLLLLVAHSCTTSNSSSPITMKNYKTTSIDQINIAPAKLIGADWMLITAGTPDAFNTMTASWGSMGYLWNKNVVTIFVRPQRYTNEFVSSNDIFTLSFFDEQYRDALKICGSKSGRNTNKVQEAGLTPMPTPMGSMSFAEARMIIECKKLYVDTLRADAFIDKSILHHYPAGDFHIVYTAEVLNVYTR